MSEYIDFLKSKVEVAPVSGFHVDVSEVNPVLKPHQKDAVIWAAAGGRRALFESFGLGKSAQELEYCRLVLAHEGGKALIVLPLGVRQEFRRDAVQLLGMEEPKYITSPEEATEDGKIYMTNYERVRDGEIDPKCFTACVLDEAAVLRSFGSKTYQTFLPKFKGVKYKLVATATPAPNRLKELIHYAGFLEIMDTGQALTRFFQRDSTKANNLTLYPHKAEEFWLWVSSWALFISKPSDLGYDDDGYALPPMDVRPHMISRGYEGITDKNGQYKLMNDAATSLQEAARLFLHVTDVRVERLGAITRNQVRAEGVPDFWPMPEVYCPQCKGSGLVGTYDPYTLGYKDIDCPYCSRATKRFANLWNSTIKKSDLPIYGWYANPWVWVIEFERCEKPEED